MINNSLLVTKYINSLRLPNLLNFCSAILDILEILHIFVLNIFLFRLKPIICFCYFLFVLSFSHIITPPVPTLSSLDLLHQNFKLPLFAFASRMTLFFLLLISFPKNAELDIIQIGSIFLAG